MKKKFLIILFIAVLIIMPISYLVWQFIKRTEETAFRSCLASIEADLYNLNYQAPVRLNETENWQILNETDTEIVLNSVKDHDCKGKDISELKDPFGNKVLIAYKHNSRGTVFLIWTPGKDMISGNNDDLVNPTGAKTIPIN